PGPWPALSAKTNWSCVGLIAASGTSKVLTRAGADGPCVPLESLDGAVTAVGSFGIVPGCALSLSANLKLSPLVTADETLSSRREGGGRELAAGGCGGWLLATSLICGSALA